MCEAPVPARPIESAATGAVSASVGAAGGVPLLVAWEDSRNAATTGKDIWGILLGPDGEPASDEFVIDDSPGDQTTPRVSAGFDANRAGSFLVVYESRSPALRLARRVGDGSTATLHDGTFLTPSVVAAGRRVAIDGALLDPAPLLIGDGDYEAARPNLAFDPDDGLWLVVYSAQAWSRSSEEGFFCAAPACPNVSLKILILGARVSATNPTATAVLDAPKVAGGVPIDLEGPRKTRQQDKNPAVAFARNAQGAGHGEFLVTWDANHYSTITGGSGPQDILGTFVAPDGSTRNHGFLIQGARACQEGPRLTSDGSAFLVCSSDERFDGCTTSDSYCVRVTPLPNTSSTLAPCSATGLVSGVASVGHLVNGGATCAGPDERCYGCGGTLVDHDGNPATPSVCLEFNSPAAPASMTGYCSAGFGTDYVLDPVRLGAFNYRGGGIPIAGEFGLAGGTTTSTGTGNLTVAASASRPTFAMAYGLNTPFRYRIYNATQTAWEEGTGYLSASTTLVRSEVSASSNNNARVAFATGTKQVVALRGDGTPAGQNLPAVIQSQLRAAFDGTHYLLSYVDGGALRVKGLTTGGTLLDTVVTEDFPTGDPRPQGVLASASVSGDVTVATVPSWPGFVLSYATGGKPYIQFAQITADECAPLLPENEAPVARCQNVLVVADDVCGAAAAIDDGSFDPDETEPTIVQSPAGPFPLGATEVMLSVSDGELSSSCTATVTVIDDTAPVQGTCPEIIAECTGLGGAVVDPGYLAANDNCAASTELTYSRSEGAGFFPVGAHDVEQTVCDPSGRCAHETCVVRVVDTQPPTMVATLEPQLWPPNHNYIEVGPEACGIALADGCHGASGEGEIALLGATSDELEDATEAKGTSSKNGDGSTLQDIKFLASDRVALRAERQGGGDGRVYTLRFRGRDASGLFVDATCRIEVPHDQSPASRAAVIDSGVRYSVVNPFTP